MPPGVLPSRLRCPSSVRSHTQRPPRGNGLVRGAAPQLLLRILRDSRRARGDYPLLSGISYFRSCIYILDAAARCCQMPAQAPCPPPAARVHLLSRSHPARWQLVATRPVCPLPERPEESWTETQGQAGPGLGVGVGGGLAAGPEGDACHFPNPLKSPSLGAPSPAPTRRSLPART